VRLAINLDMIGRLRKQYVEVYGTRTATGLRELVSRSNRDDLDLDFLWTMQEDSDHYTFYKAGIPSLMLHTGLHENYHRPSDDVQTLNIEGMRQMTRCVLALAINAAQAPELPEFRPASQGEASGKEPAPPTAPRPQPRLGVVWSPVEFEGEPRLQAASLVPGLPAEQAGLRVGDRLLEIDGKPVYDDKHARLAFMSAEKSVMMRLARPGLEEPINIAANLLGKPVRVGVNWREDAAEPGVVVLTGVIPGSPAANAGLAPRDRILEVNGERFSGPAELFALLNRSTSPMRLTLERRGRIYSTDLELAP
jgi:membrane-associated protease RseP (regulator of RpoE activity)